MQALLLVKGARQAVPKGSSEKTAEDNDDDGVGLGAAALRLIKPWGAVVDVVGSHERTSERAHVQHYALRGIPCQRFFLPFFFFLGLLVTLLTVST